MTDGFYWLNSKEVPDDWAVVEICGNAVYMIDGEYDKLYTVDSILLCGGKFVGPLEPPK